VSVITGECDTVGDNKGLKKLNSHAFDRGDCNINTYIAHFHVGLNLLQLSTMFKAWRSEWLVHLKSVNGAS